MKRVAIRVEGIRVVEVSKELSQMFHFFLKPLRQFCDITIEKLEKSTLSLLKLIKNAKLYLGN